MTTKLKMMLGILLMTVIYACRKDKVEPPNENPIPVNVFFDDDLILTENEGPQEIEMQFDKPAFDNGLLKIAVTTDFPNAFQTDPGVLNGILELQLMKGSEFTSFTFTPLNNEVLNENRIISFELSAVSEGFRIGNKKSSTVTILDDESSVAANFEASSGLLSENNAQGLTVHILLSGPTRAEGKLVIALNGPQEEGYFSSEPVINANGQIILDVPLGATSASFKLIPINNALLKGHKTLKFSISDTEGGIVKGTQLLYELTLIDDELVSKPKSFETSGGNWRSKKTYEYNESGMVQMVHWETETPALRTGTDTYYYAANNLIERINRFPNIDEYFFQENGRIVRSENIENGIKTAYIEYDYDPAGNLGGKAVYYRQSSGEFKLGFIFVYLYFTNGNIHKQLTYIPGQDPEDEEAYQLISTRTYDGYSNIPNPFPMIEIIPNIVAQQHLPGSYRLEENGVNLLYHFSYEFREDGLPIRRHTSGGGSELTTYQYY